MSENSTHPSCVPAFTITQPLKAKGVNKDPLECWFPFWGCGGALAFCVPLLLPMLP